MARFSLKWLFGIPAGVGLCYVGGQGAIACLMLASLVMFFYPRPFTVGFAVTVLGVVAVEICFALTSLQLVRIDSTPDGLRARAAMERKTDRLLRLNAMGLFLSGLTGGLIFNALSSGSERANALMPTILLSANNDHHGEAAGKDPQVPINPDGACERQAGGHHERPSRLTLRDVLAAMAFSSAAAAALYYVMARDRLADRGLLIVFYASLLVVLPASTLAAIGCLCLGYRRGSLLWPWTAGLILVVLAGLPVVFILLGGLYGVLNGG